MRNLSFKKLACLFTLFCFLWLTIGADFVFAQNQDPLAEAANFFMQRNYDKAIQILDSFIKSNQSDPQQKLRIAEAHYLLAKINFELRNDVQVSLNLKKLFYLAPDFKKEESNPSFKQILGEFKNNPVLKGWQAYHRGEFEEAVRLLEEFVKTNPALTGEKEAAAEAHYLMAKIYFESRDDVQANVQLHKVLEILPELSLPEENPGFKFRFSQLKTEMANQTPPAIQSKPMERPVVVESDKIGKSATPAVEEKIKKKKKFPWLLVAAGVVVIGLVVYFVLVKKPNFNLNISVDEGVAGTPVSGIVVYKKGTKVLYSYSLKPNYKNLVVTINGITSPASGEIVMDQNVTLIATSSELLNFKLDVTIGVGVIGNPPQGSLFHTEGSVVVYSYSLANGYKDLLVKLDGSQVAASGTVTMNADHVLDASATEEKKEYTLIVEYYNITPLYGSPSTGTYVYPAGTTIYFNYHTNCGDPDWAPSVEVYLNGVRIAFDSVDGPVSGSFTLDRDSRLRISTG